MDIRVVIKKIIAVVLICISLGAVEAQVPKNVIFFIGDGMGPNQVIAGRMYHGGPLSFDQFEVRGKIKTHSADKKVTDSAASATAYSAGVKVNNGVIALRMPGDGSRLPTMLEYYKQQGKWVGLVSDDEITGATPASFAAHQTNRGLAKQIADDYFNDTRPHVLFGGGSKGISATTTKDANYLTATNRDEFLSMVKMTKGSDKVPDIAAIFGRDKFPYLYQDKVDKKNEYGKKYPYLHEMTHAAIDILSKNEKGFFLMVESSHTDKSGHAINTRKTTRTGCNSTAVIELSKAVEKAIQFAKGRNDTLIIVTADHETGGMTIIKDNGPGQLATLKWAHKSHTATDVDVFATGPGSQLFKGTMDNTEVFKKIAKLCSFDQVKLPEETE